MAKRPAEAPATGLTLSGSRVALRPMTGDDIASIEPWYGEAAAAVHGLPPEEAGSIQNLYCQLEEAQSDLDAGLLVLTLTLGFILVAPELRGLGYGSKAVRALEAEALQLGLARRFRADVDMGNGLGFYFWLRLGYHAATPAEQEGGPWPADVTWMIRRYHATS